MNQIVLDARDRVGEPYAATAEGSAVLIYLINDCRGTKKVAEKDAERQCWATPGGLYYRAHRSANYVAELLSERRHAWAAICTGSHGLLSGGV